MVLWMSFQQSPSSTQCVHCRERGEKGIRVRILGYKDIRVRKGGQERKERRRKGRRERKLEGNLETAFELCNVCQ